MITNKSKTPGQQSKRLIENQKSLTPGTSDPSEISPITRIVNNQLMQLEMAKIEYSDDHKLDEDALRLPNIHIEDVNMNDIDNSAV